VVSSQTKRPRFEDDASPQLKRLRAKFELDVRRCLQPFRIRASKVQQVLAALLPAAVCGHVATFMDVRSHVSFAQTSRALSCVAAMPTSFPPHVCVAASNARQFAQGDKRLSLASLAGRHVRSLTIHQDVRDVPFASLPALRTLRVCTFDVAPDLVAKLGAAASLTELSLPLREGHHSSDFDVATSHRIVAAIAKLHLPALTSLQHVRLSEDGAKRIAACRSPLRQLSFSSSDDPRNPGGPRGWCLNDEEPHVDCNMAEVLETLRGRSPGLSTLIIRTTYPCCINIASTRVLRAFTSLTLLQLQPSNVPASKTIHADLAQLPLHTLTVRTTDGDRSPTLWYGGDSLLAHTALREVKLSIGYTHRDSVFKHLCGAYALLEHSDVQGRRGGA
jgi:hypothetical protein